MKIICKNKKALHNYFVEERFEAGIVLAGSEVKSLRAGLGNLVDSYSLLRDGEVWLLKMHISPYMPASLQNHEPTRDRKLLLHHEQIRQLGDNLKTKGCTLIPLSVYLKAGKIKVELGLCRGKKKFDKRDTMKKRSADREMERAIKR
ncbi:MAG: SsrA-binding protein [Deltaproteobacteria bacterium CG11_big_fil_rev_8_21_14_0_20_42_23]|nr:MAG: SsrA-binding protein [Deltaproteobacteria bacterium CG11_big_fil_rev_8_21_14_0_20_42_23]PJC64861.1 MAG: SsrA-binding protein [Deltaproteobacteria bacterium CG_4_9_14_0_2_um_filter_42_21]